MEINSVYKTDCLLGFKTIDDESADLIFTDPPYCQNRAQNITNLKNHRDIVTEFKFDGYASEQEYLQFIENVLRECYRVAKNGASGYLWCGDDFVSYINRIMEKAGFQFRKVIHWHKTNPFPAIHSRKMFANSMELLVHFSKGTPKTWNYKQVNEMHNFIEAPICMGKERKKHQTQKPLKVCIPFIEISSNAGDLILDPFMGSGTTAIAALMTGRNFAGFEIDDNYCNIIDGRFEEFLLQTPNFTGAKPAVK
jgi:site-specific DNA-methyltransferase (adenine-specific)/modification methylase